MRNLIAILTVMVFAAPAMAADQSSGCGLGWQVASKNSLFSSSTRSTTNGLFSNQTFGMTSGTSGCAKHSIIKNDRKPEHFIEANYASLSVEMARGQGEYLAALAEVMGCPVAPFAKMSQERYEQIMPAAEVPATQVLENMKSQIQVTPELSSSCAITG